MKKLKKIALASILLSGSMFAFTSCENVPDNSTPEPPIIETVQYGLTISYPDNTQTTIKQDENTLLSLNDYAKNISGYKFVGFFLEENYQTQITTYEFTQNRKIYAKYDLIDNNLKPDPKPVHEHKYNENYDYNNEKHWKSCKDGDSIIEEASHTFVKEAKPEYLFEDATYTSKALYYSHCSVCNALGPLFESGDKLHYDYSLQILSNVDGITYSFTFKDNETFDVQNIINNIKDTTEIKGIYEVEGLYIDSNYSVLFDKNILNNHTTVYLKLNKLSQDITVHTVGLENDTTFTLGKNKNETLTLEDLVLNLAEDYEVEAWYFDSELTENFEELTVTGPLTLYAKCKKKLLITSQEYYSENPSWYYYDKYTENDLFNQKLVLEFNKNITDATAVMIDDLGNSYTGVVTINGSILEVKFTLTVDDIKNPVYYKIVEKYQLTVDGKNFEILDGETLFELTGKELTTPVLDSTSIYNDYSNYILNKESSPSIWKTIAKENYTGSIDFESKWKSLNDSNNIDMNNLDVLYLDLTLEEDVTISSREKYLNSIFAIKNYCGNFNLNGHTITLAFDGYVGDTVFENNYGTIYNGYIVISGARKSRNNNTEFNVLENSYAVLKNNYGYIHDVNFEIKNFGFDFNTKHNVNYAIECNMPFALVENCKFGLNIKYNGTKLDRIKNPLATSSAGIFGEVKTGTTFDFSLYSASSQELKNLSVNINSVEISDELKETGLVKLTCNTNKDVELKRFSENGIYSGVSNNKTFYGGNYYFDGTNYIKFNNALFDELKYDFDGKYHYKQLNDYFNNVRDIHNAMILTYGKIKSYTLNSMTLYYLESNYCEYGYLTPELGMIAYDNTYTFSNSSNLQYYRSFTKDNEYLANYDAKYIEDYGDEEYVRVHYTESRKNVAFTNSNVRIWCDTDGLNFNNKYIYAVYDFSNNNKSLNEDWNKDAYVNGKEWWYRYTAK